jgi:hypothetical protein
VIPWRPLLVVTGISVSATTAIAALSASKGWTVHSPAWGALAIVAMWAPALGRFAASRTVDRDFRGTLPLHRWGATGVQVVLWPIVLPLESYRARSLWPAVFFHSFHNTISQWLFPKLFAGGENELWLGEAGLLPVAGYMVAGVALYIWMRRRRSSWQHPGNL